MASFRRRKRPRFSCSASGCPSCRQTADGRDDIAVKPLPADALIYRLQAMLIRSGRTLPEESGAWAEVTEGTETIGTGQVISVFAPKGGVGKTTISVNLAVALREQTHASVLLFDADVGVGNVTAILDAPATLGLADLADSPPEEWTDAAFEHVTSTHAPTGLRVLTWGSDPSESERVTVDLLLAALRWARSHTPGSSSTTIPATPTARWRCSPSPTRSCSS